MSGPLHHKHRMTPSLGSTCVCFLHSQKLSLMSRCDESYQMLLSLVLKQALCCSKAQVRTMQKDSARTIWSQCLDEGYTFEGDRCQGL